jgi:hypothetical protein
MHTTLAFLLAAGQLTTAYESQFSYSPRATTSDDNLATITTLVDGHLPTCFTGHPTSPCPTDEPGAKRDLTQDLNNAAHMIPIPIDPVSMTAGHGSNSLPVETPEPVVVERDAPLVVANRNYIPQPSEWAIPSDFTFTDTISNTTTSSDTPKVTLTTSSSAKATVASATATPHSDSYFKSSSNYFNREDTYAKKLNISAMIESMTREFAIQPTGDALLQSSNATTSTAAITSMIGHTTALPSISSGEHIASNSSSSAHLTGSIGTLLSQAMFPGKMRAPTTTISQVSAPATTEAPSAEHIVPIPMSQRPNTTAPDATLQAFAHTINTEELAASKHTSSSVSILPAFAFATPLAQKPKDFTDPKVATSGSRTVQQATEPSVAPLRKSVESKVGERLHHYLHSGISNKSATPLETPIASSSTTAVETPSVLSANRNDTQALTLINSNGSATLTQAQPTATPESYKRAHHHPRARRFIS